MATQVTFNDNLEEFLNEFASVESLALLDIGIEIQRDAALNSPVRTGNLRKSWTVDVNENEHYVEVGVPRDALERNYAKYVELGTTRQRAQHMLERAVQSNAPKFGNIFRARIQWME